MIRAAPSSRRSTTTAAVDAAIATPWLLRSSSGFASSTPRPGVRLAAATPARIAALAAGRLSGRWLIVAAITRQRRALTSTFATNSARASASQPASAPETAETIAAKSSDATNPARMNRPRTRRAARTHVLTDISLHSLHSLHGLGLRASRIRWCSLPPSIWKTLRPVSEEGDQAGHLLGVKLREVEHLPKVVFV